MLARVSGSARNTGISPIVGMWTGFGEKGRGFRQVTSKATDVVDLVARVIPESKPEDALTITAASVGVGEWQGDLVIIPLYSASKEDKKEGEDAPLAQLTPAAKELDGILNGAVSEMIQEYKFKGNAGEKVVSFLPGNAIKRVALVGAGDASKVTPDTLQSLGASIASVANDNKAKKALLAGAPDKMTEALPTGIFLNLYSDNRFRTGDNISKPPTLTSLEIAGVDAGTVDDLVSKARGICSGVRLARDLVGAPPNFLTPSSMAGIAEKIGKETGMEVKILDEAKCKQMGMGSYLGVAQGAIEPPKFIHMKYNPSSGNAKKKVALIGKGLTFDSGGYNLKAGAGSMIELMKFDMGGSAAVLGAAQSIGLLKPEDVEVHFIVAACENMLSDRAMRPGDILTASNGKTIEVINTDAEGRLTLADALIYAEDLKVDKIVDLATLTGACIISLGNEYAGMWSPNDELASELESSAKETGEKLWRMPLVESYKEELKSKIADLKNVGGRAGGSITAALFLNEFVKKTPWAHIDMAGPVWDSKNGAGTGYGVRTLVNFVQK